MDTGISGSLKSFAVCSDSDVGKRQGKNDDRVIAGISDLQYPATTNAASLQKHMGDHHSDDAMTVVFSTYHSIGVLNEAQTTGIKPIPAFDLIVCDEAHRTTGATFEGKRNLRSSASMTIVIFRAPSASI